MSDDHIKNVEPPVLPTRFLNWCLPEALREPVLGDLCEGHHLLCRKGQEGFAGLWYTRQALHTGLQYLWKTRRIMLMFILSLVLFSAVILMAMVLGGGMAMFWNLPSFLIVVPPAILFAIGATSWRDFGAAFGCLLDDHQNADEVSIRVFSVLGNSAIWMGALGVVIGFISMASNISVENFSKVVGPASAVCMLTLFYGMAIKLLCYVAEQRLHHRAKISAG